MASTDALFYSDVKGRAASADYDFALVWAVVLLLALGLDEHQVSLIRQKQDVMKKRVIRVSVIVRTPAGRCSRKSGMMLPRLATTLP